MRPVNISAVMTRDGTGQAALFWKVSKGNLLCQVVGFFIAYNAYVRFDFDEVNGSWAVDYAVSNDLKKVLMQVQGRSGLVADESVCVFDKWRPSCL